MKVTSAIKQHGYEEKSFVGGGGGNIGTRDDRLLGDALPRG
jgi:hypothetical protein